MEEWLLGPVLPKVYVLKKTGKKCHMHTPINDEADGSELLTDK